MSTDVRVNAKGDLAIGVGDNEIGIVPVGLTGQVLTADPTRLTGVSWQDSAGGVVANPFDRWNLKGLSGDPFAYQGSVGIGSGVVFGSLVYVPAGEPITNLWAAVRSGGTYSASAVPNQIGAWTEAGVPIGNTADDDTLWAAGGGWRGGAVVGGPIAAQDTGRWIYIAWIVGGFDVVNFPFPVNAVDDNAVWFAFGPGVTRRGAFYIAGGQSALPGTFNPTSIGTATTSAPLVGFN